MNKENHNWQQIVNDLLATRTQRGLARELDVTQKQVWNWKSGATTPIKPYQKVLLELWNKSVIR